MPRNFSGHVFFANGSPAENIQVHVFDKDEPDKKDDDLTINPGLSDKTGNFTVTYEPSRYLDHKEIEIKIPLFGTRRIRIPDISDVYLPYLQFRYDFINRTRTYNAALNPFEKEFRLPEMIPVDFKPSLHGFKFDNSFDGYPLPFSVRGLPSIPNVPDSYGLCGGMSSAAYDFILAGRSIPDTPITPEQGSPLQKYLYKRQIDTFGSFGEYIVKFFRWMNLPDDTIHGTCKLTYDEFENIQAKLDDKNLVQLGLVYVKWGASREVWENHQVLSYGYSETLPNILTINIYDPNFQDMDDVTIRAERIPVGSIISYGSRKITVFGLKCSQMLGKDNYKDIRGFFAMPYAPIIPPAL